MKKQDAEAFKILKAFPHMTLAQANWLLGASAYSPHCKDAAEAIACISKQIQIGNQVFGIMHEVKFMELAKDGYKWHPGHIAPEIRPGYKDGHFWCIA